MLDIFAIASGNADTVQIAFESVVDAMPGDRSATVREFAAWIEAEALLSINVKPYVIVEFIIGRRHQNIYEWAAEQSRLSGRTSEDVLRERLQGFYDKRVTFDRAFEKGEEFHYSALNAGGVGLPEYSPYCAVLTREFQASLSHVALLPGDSLKICFAADGSFDEALVKSRVAPHARRHLVVAKERASEVSTDKAAWAGLVTSPGRYFEAVFIGIVSINSVKCVRVLKTEYDRMWDLAFASFGRRLGEAERALVHDFVQIRRAVLDGRIQLEVVA